MRLLLCFLLLVSGCHTSCTVISGNASKGTYSLATVGGDLKDYAQTAQGATVASVDNSTSFRHASDTVRRMVYATIAGSVLKNGIAGWQSVTNTKTGAEVTKQAATEATKQTTINAQAATEQARISAEAATLTPPVP